MLSERPWLLAAFAAAVCAIAGCATAPIATTRLPSPAPSSLATLTPYSVSTTIPLPAGAVPVTIALPTPAGGGNVIAGSITFPAPTTPYGANAAVGVSVSTNGSPAGPAASSRSRGTLDLNYSVNQTSVSLWWIVPVTYPTAPTVTISNAPQFNFGGGYYFNWGYPAVWMYVTSGTNPLTFISGAAPITLPAFPFVLSGTILQSAFGLQYRALSSSVTVAAGSSALAAIYSSAIYSSSEKLFDAPPYTAAGCGSGTTATATASFGAGNSDNNTIPVTITGVSPGTCTMYLLNAYNFSTPVSVTVTASIQPVNASVTSVTVPGAGVAATFTVSQSGYTGAFSTSGCGSSVATASAGATANNSATITVTGGAAGGSCNLVVTGGQSQSVTIPVSVAVTTVTGS